MKINEIAIHCKYDKIIKLDEFVPHELNTNHHPEKQIEVLGKLIKRDGVRWPIIISKLSGKCVAGHGRFLAFAFLEMEKMPVVFQEFESVAAEYRFLEADNHIAEFAQHDKEKMIENLAGLDFDMGEFDFEDLGLIDFTFHETPDVKNTNKELDTDNFGNDLEHECPKCGFCYDKK